MMVILGLGIWVGLGGILGLDSRTTCGELQSGVGVRRLGRVACKDVYQALQTGLVLF